MENLFSINKAADLLERDRQTLVRALRHVPPDGHERGQPRWYMPTIVAALAVKPKERREVGKARHRYRIRGSNALDDLRATFEARVKQISAEPSPSKRHAMAVALAPLLAEFEAKYLSVGRSLRIADDIDLSFNIDLIVEEAIEEVAEAAGRTSDSTFFAEMNEAMAHADDGEVV